MSITSSTSEEEPSTTDETGISPEKAELILIKATGLKEAGNQEFRDGELDKAARSYRRGVASLKKLNRHNTGDVQVQALLVTLHTNLSTVLFKSQKYRVSAEVAGQALAVDADNVKARFRRAVARRQLGDLEAARTDLRAALAVDPGSAACKKELVAIKKELEAAKENQKKALSKAFGGSKNGGGGGFLYDDKEDAAKRRQEEERRKKKQEEELLKQRKQQWEDDCVKLMADNQPAISFEDWEKQRIAREEADAKAKEEERKAEEKRRQEERRKAKLQATTTAARSIRTGR